MSTRLSEKDGFQALVLLGKLCEGILKNGHDPQELIRISTEGKEFMQGIQDKMIDAGLGNPEREDCYSKDNPLWFFESQLREELFVLACSTLRAKAAGAELRAQADEWGA
jgi:hypothetical protein